MAVRREATSEPVRQQEYELLAAFRYALRQFLRFSERAARRRGLTPQQHHALLALNGFPGAAGATIGDLAERLQVRHHSAVGLVDRLVQGGLLIRETGLADRRKVFLRLTPRAERELERLAVAHRQELRRLGPRLGQLLQALTGVKIRPARGPDSRPY